MPNAPHGSVASVTITVRWGTHVLAVERVRRGEPFSLRDGDGRWALPEGDTPDGQLLQWDERGQPWLLPPGGRRRLLAAAETTTVACAALTFELEACAETPATIARPRLRWRALALHALAGALVAGGLFASRAATPTDWYAGGREAEREYQAYRHLVRAQERDDVDSEVEVEEREQALALNGTSQEGGTGTRAKGEEGSMGQPGSSGYGNRYGVAGPGDGANPTVARQHAMRDAAEFGMIGLLHSGAGGGSSPWGRDDALGHRPDQVIAPGGYRDHGINPPTDPARDPVSTFAIDVDTGAYALARRQLQQGAAPPPGSVRAEEFINYFDYDYAAPDPQSPSPLTAHIDAAPSPFERGHHLVRVALQAKRPDPTTRKPVHLVYLVDTSGSMQSPDKLDLAADSLRILTRNLKPGDTVAICTYAGSTLEVLKPTDVENRATILQAIARLQSDGGTAMNSGMATAYRLASDSFVKDHVNRVVVLSDGDANIGPDSPEAILRTIKQYRDKGITLSTIGFGTGNYRDDMMEQLADAGDGNYSYIDSQQEAQRVFSSHVDGLLEVVARDVKLQVEFDPRVVRRYRLIGYENRDIADKDFRNDKVDAGEVGMGHSVTALYDVELRAPAHTTGGWVKVRVRHKAPEGGAAEEALFALTADRVARDFNDTPERFRLAVAAGGFAEVLRKSPYAKSWTLQEVAAVASGAGAAPEVAQLRDLIAAAQPPS